MVDHRSSPPAAFWLSFHAPYACHHSGACCSSGWAIPVERSRVGTIETLRAVEWLQDAPAAPDDVAGILATRADGRCVFYRGASHLDGTKRAHPPRGGCAIHHELGPTALPSACQHFPRQCLIDPRGVFITLSHYCPTAAELLFTQLGPATIVSGPPAIPAGDPEGLDARDALPPPLTSAVLMDHAGYAAWEAHMIGILAGDDAQRSGRRPEQSVALLDEHVRMLTRWRPGGASLADTVRALRSDDPLPVAAPGDWAQDRRMVNIVRTSLGAQTWPEIPPNLEETWRTRVLPAWADHRAVVGRFLAAHAFASWMAYQGNGLPSLVHHLRAALAVLRVETTRACLVWDQPLSRSSLKQSLRQADLLLVHLIDRDALASQLATYAA